MLQRFSGPSHYKYVLLLLLLISGQRHGIIHLQSCRGGHRVSNSCSALLHNVLTFHFVF